MTRLSHIGMGGDQVFLFVVSLETTFFQIGFSLPMNGSAVGWTSVRLFVHARWYSVETFHKNLVNVRDRENEVTDGPLSHGSRSEIKHMERKDGKFSIFAHTVELGRFFKVSSK